MPRGHAPSLMGKQCFQSWPVDLVIQESVVEHALAPEHQAKVTRRATRSLLRTLLMPPLNLDPGPGVLHPPRLGVAGRGGELRASGQHGGGGRAPEGEEGAAVIAGNK